MILSFLIKRNELIIDVNRVKIFLNVFDLFLTFIAKSKKNIVETTFCVCFVFFFEHVI